MVDSHTHLYLREFFLDGGLEAVKRALGSGVDKLVLPNIDENSVRDLLNLHNAYPLNTFVAAGLHPTEVTKNWKASLNNILQEFADIQLIAIGEVGIDKHWDVSCLIEQMDAFGEQISIAIERDLPIVIHSRDAADETFEIVKQFSRENPRYIFHSYPYSPREAEKILGYFPSAMFGFNGVITFKNATATREAASFVGIERILSETDSPYLTPVPFRGKTNESSYIPYIIKAIAEATLTDFEEAKRIIDRNSDMTFRFDRFLSLSECRTADK